jgi:tryptophan-rich sensory protein
MGCPVALADSTDVLNASFWAAFTLVAHCLGTYMCWNKRWYAHLHTWTLAPSEKVGQTILVALAMANAFAAWRVWFCDDWDTTRGLVVLAVYVFMIIVHNLFVPSIMLTTSPPLAIVVALGASILSIVFTVFCYLYHHDWSGLIGIADIVINLALLIFAIQLQTMPKVYAKYDEVKDAYQSPSQRNTSEKTSSAPAPVQSAIGGQYAYSSIPTGGQDLRFRANAATPNIDYSTISMDIGGNP